MNNHNPIKELKQLAHLIINSTLNILNNIFLPVIFLFIRKRKRNIKYYFSLCAIFKNEARYFREWIEYHRMLGVDHIYLYNNFSTDNFNEVLHPHINEGYVTLIDWPFELSQLPAYQHCFDNFKDDSYWLMFLDLDEFICPLFKTNIKDWIIPYEKYPSVLIYWLMFGSNGIIDYDPNKLVIEQYTNSWDAIHNVGKQVLNTAYMPVKMYHHYIYCWINIFGIKVKVPSVNEKYRFITNPNTERCPKHSTIQINHYWSKCLNEYIRKIDKGDMFSKQNESFFYLHEHKNTAENKVIYRFLTDLKIRMNGIKIVFKEFGLND